MAILLNPTQRSSKLVNRNMNSFSHSRPCIICLLYKWPTDITLEAINQLFISYLAMVLNFFPGIKSACTSCRKATLKRITSLKRQAGYFMSCSCSHNTSSFQQKFIACIMQYIFKASKLTKEVSWLYSMQDHSLLLNTILSILLTDNEACNLWKCKSIITSVDVI